MAETVINELVVDASGASAGADQYVAAMQKAEAASNAAAASTDKVQASVDKQTVSMTGSYGRQVSQFNRLAAAADPAVAAQQKLEKATTTGSKALAAGAVTQEQYNNIIGLYQERLKRASGATDDAAHAHANFSTQAMAAQHAMRSTVEMMAQGVPVTQVLAMHINEVAYAASGPGGLTAALKEGIGVFKQFLTPLTVSLGVLGAVGIGFAYLYHSIKTSELAFSDLSDRIGATLAQLHGLQSNALLSSGISQSDFLKQMQTFGTNVENAQHGLGNIAEILRANGMQAKTFNDYLARAADLVRNASSEQEKYRVVQALGLPATLQWVQYLSQGGDAITKAANETNGWGDAAEREMIAKARKFDTEWSSAWEHFKDKAKEVLIDIASWKPPDWWTSFLNVFSGGTYAQGFGYGPQAGQASAGDMVGSAFKQLGHYYNPQLQTALDRQASGHAATVLPGDAKHALQLEQQRISILGSLQTIQNKVRLSEIQINQARLNGVAVSGQEEAAILNVVRAQAEWAKINNASQVGVFNLADATKAAADQLRAWQNQGLVDAHNAQEMAAAHQVLAERIKQSADAAALAATPYKQLKQMEIDYADTSKQVDAAAASSLQGIESGLNDLATGSKTAGNAFKEMGLSIVKALEDMIIKMTIIEPLARTLQATLSGGFGGGLLGGGLLSLFGFQSGGSFVVPAGSGAMALPGFAGGADWTVPGSGPPDSKVTAFRVSPGERVTVTPPGHSGGVAITQNIIVDGATGNTEVKSMVEAGVARANNSAAQMLASYRRGGLSSDLKEIRRRGL